MKTAEEWSQQTSVNGNPPDVSEWWIKQIQLDAWKQGMTDAAALGDEIAYGRRQVGNDHEMMARDSGIADLQQAIINKRDQ